MNRPHHELATPILRLRRLVETDLHHLVRLDSNPEVMRFLTGGAATPQAVIEQEILPRMMSYHERFAGLGYWAAIDKATGGFAGWFSLRATRHWPKEAELGFRIMRSFWGKGIATEGSRALVRHAFAQPSIQRVLGTTYEDNAGSRRVMEKVGMRLIRSFRMTLEEVAAIGTVDASTATLWEGDDVEYAITRDEWERQERT